MTVVVFVDSKSLISCFNRFGLCWALLATLLLALATTANSYCQAVDSFDAAADYPVFSLALQTDGNVLATGAFSFLDGQPRPGIGRLYSDGSIDPSFSPTTSGFQIIGGAAILENDKLVTVADFALPGGGIGTALGRLNVNGSPDPTFPPQPIVPGQGLSEEYCLAVQSDGRILVGGSYVSLGGHACTNLARLNTDGSLDTSFNASVGGATNYVNCVAVQPDGKVLVGGNFGTLPGPAWQWLRRLNSDGSLDETFSSAAGVAVGAADCVVIQPDGRIIAAGNFKSPAGTTALVRFYPDGGLDTNLNVSSFDVRCISLQADGKILFGGGAASLKRLNSDGTVDTTFTNPVDLAAVMGGTPLIDGLAIESSGEILLGGYFDLVGGVGHTNLAELQNTEAALDTLSFDGATVNWLRGGASPEIGFAKFDVSTNGSDWSALGLGQRIQGGWSLSASGLSPGTAIRARGLVQSGFHESASWFVQSTVGRSSISSQPLSQTNNAGSVARFDVVGGGDPPVAYGWQKDGAPLTEGDNISGSRTAALTLSNVLFADGGGYSVVVSNAAGSVTSAVATLTVIDPIILTGPTNQLVNVGHGASFSVAAVGTPPLSYQWVRDGTNLAGETSATLSLTNVQTSDNGSVYQVQVGNMFGNVTSAAAQLSVNSVLTDAFNPGANNSINTLAVQPDGKILVGGFFTSLGGQPRNCVGRLNADGTLDTAFDPGATLNSYTVNALSIQTNGSILIGGQFTTPDGQAGLVRFNSDGSRDTGFASGLGGKVTSVVALAIQRDGKILVGGFFSTIGGQAHTNLARLNPDGSVDASFNPSLSSGVLALGVQTDGGVLVGLFKGTINGQVRDYLGRLNPDGSLDTNFVPVLDGSVFSLAIQADGKILIGGEFQNLDGFALNSLGRIGRLNSDGTVDTRFNPGCNGTVESMAVESDGAILVMGGFSELGGQPRNLIGRLDPDGTVDSKFNLGMSGVFTDCASVEPDGSTLIGGAFDTVAGQPRQQLARLQPEEPTSAALYSQGSTVTWTANGAGPEFWRTTFEGSTNGADWFALGDGQRIPGGWQLPAGPLSVQDSIRARGYVQGECQGGSTWFVEDVTTLSPLTPPVILTDGNGFGMASNSFNFEVSALIGQVIVIDGSTDFQHWAPLSTNVVLNGLLPFSAPLTPGWPVRFYRARLQ